VLAAKEAVVVMPVIKTVKKVSVVEEVGMMDMGAMDGLGVSIIIVASRNMKSNMTAGENVESVEESVELVAIIRRVAE